MFAAIYPPLRVCHRPRASKKEIVTQVVGPSFNKWAKDRGVLYSKLEVKVFGNGIRGMRAIETISKDEVIVRLPREAALEVDPATKPPAFCPKDVWKKQPWYAKLAIRLMDERAKGTDSTFSGYLSILPCKFDLPVFWTQEELLSVGYSSFVRSVQEQKDEWSDLFHQLSQKVSSSAPLNKAEFMQSMAIVRSRSFNGPYIRNKLSDRLCLAIALFAFVVINLGLTGLGSFEKVLNSIIALFLFNLLDDLFVNQKSKVYLLAPAVDLINHSCTVGSNLPYDYFTDGYTVRVDRDYAKGEQVFISYGEKSNDDLLQYYGFIEKGNPNDSVTIELGLQKLHKAYRVVTQCKAKRLEAEMPISIHRGRGISSEILVEINSWNKGQKNLDRRVVSDILITFCQSEVDHLEDSRGKLSELTNLQRQKLIDDFLYEKVSILKDYINVVKQQKL